MDHDAKIVLRNNEYNFVMLKLFFKLNLNRNRNITATGSLHMEEIKLIKLIKFGHFMDMESSCQELHARKI